MNITIERKKATDCNTTATTIPKGWHNETVDNKSALNKNNLSWGKVDVFYYGPTSTTKLDCTTATNTGSKQHSQQQQQIQIRQQQQQQQHQHHQQQQLHHRHHHHHHHPHHIMEKYDLTGYPDYQNTTDNNNKTIQNVQQVIPLQRSVTSVSSFMKRKLPVKTMTMTTSTTSTTQQLSSSNLSSSITSSTTATTITTPSITSTSLCNPSPSNNNSTPSTLRHHLEFSRGIRTDVSLVPPIRQTASIFKQPVTVYKTQDSKVKNDLKHGIIQDKPKQLFWEKRLEGLRACDINGTEFNSIDLPKTIKSVGPNINEQTLLQSVATALHVSNHPITGQTASKSILIANSGVFLNPEQPLMHSVTITDDDIRRQEDRVNLARRRLQDALKG